MARLSPPAGDQWGMVTAAQARRVEVSRVDLKRLIDDGTLEPVAEAARVYRLTGAPDDLDLDPVRAAWLQLGGSRMWNERVSRIDAVVSHRSAAHVRGLGDLIPWVHEFYVPTRRRPRRPDMRLRVRSRIEPREWSLSSGLPVCTIDKIVADLLADREDESAIAQIAQDAMRDGLLSREEVRGAAEHHARDYGHPSVEAFLAVLVGPEA